VASSGKKQIFRLSPGQGAGAVADQLAGRHLIRNALYFRLLAEARGQQSSLEAGTYLISPAMPPSRILAVLAGGHVAVRRVTIPEGSTVKEIAAIMARRGVTSRRAFREAAMHFKSPFPDPKGRVLDPAEGFLFPATYAIPYGTGPEEVVDLLYATFQKKVPRALLAEGAKEGLTPDQVVILASIVQKEAKLASDQPIVAGVFLNRIGKNMPLGSDATLDYALGVKNDQLTVADIASKSPYNTFHRPGFPPGPIDCPGLQAIRAVLEAKKVPYLYFYSLPNGRDIFSKTYAEQLAVERRYKKVPNRAAATQPAK